MMRPRPARSSSAPQVTRRPPTATAARSAPELPFRLTLHSRRPVFRPPVAFSGHDRISPPRRQKATRPEINQPDPEELVAASADHFDVPDVACVLPMTWLGLFRQRQTSREAGTQSHG